MENPANAPFVSVLIPAFNAPQKLARCLEHLARQTYLASRREVIVIDNGSSPSLRPVVARFEGVIYEFEAAIGSYAARNRGIARARGEILAFTDADCLPAANWLEKGVLHLQSEPGCGLVGGRIVLTFQQPRAPNVWEMCDQLYMGFRQRAYLKGNRFAVTANAFTFRHVLEEIGGFEASLKSGGDVEWGNRVADANYRLTYAEDALIQHAARASRTEMLRKVRRLQGGHLAQERRQISYKRWLARNVRATLLSPRKFTLEREKLALLETYRNADGDKIHFSRAFKTKVLLARWLMLAAGQIEVARILLGGRARRE